METSNGCKNNKKKTTWSGFLLILLLQVEVQNLFKEVSPRWANSKTDILLQGFNIFNINRQLCWVIHKNQQPFLQDMEQTQIPPQDQSAVTLTWIWGCWSTCCTHCLMPKFLFGFKLYGTDTKLRQLYILAKISNYCFSIRTMVEETKFDILLLVVALGQTLCVLRN